MLTNMQIYSVLSVKYSSIGVFCSISPRLILQCMTTDTAFVSSQPVIVGIVSVTVELGFLDIQSLETHRDHGL